MDIKLNNQKGNVAIWPERVFTQRESNTTQGQTETQPVEDKGKKIEKILVAGLVKKSNRILATISTHKFPFDLFPDTINVEEGRVTIIIRKFFSSSQIHSVDIKDISNIFINTAPFLFKAILDNREFGNILRVC